MKAPYAGIIFDFNDVLWWDKELQEESWSRFTESFRGYGFSQEELSVHVHGHIMEFTLNYLSSKRLAQGEVKELGERKESMYRELYLEHGEEFHLSPGAEPLLDFLLERKIRRRIDTASGAINLGIFVEHLCLELWFEMSQIVYDDGTTPGKPVPDFYVSMARLKSPKMAK